MARHPAGVAASLRRVLIPLACCAGAAGFAGRWGAPPEAVAAAAAGCVLLAWLALELWLGRPLDRLARALLVAARDDPRHAPPSAGRLAARLGEATAALQARLAAAEAAREAALAAATARVEEQKRRLEAILLDLSEGVVVCARDHQVLLYNQVAAELVDASQSLGLGRPVTEVLSRAPLDHHLERLERRPEAGRAERFVCATQGAARLLQARMALTTDAAGAPTGYVLTLSDTGAEIDRAARLERTLRAGLERQNGLLASLRAAVETLAEVPELEAGQRHAFERVLLEDSLQLSEQNAALATALEELGGRSWPMAEIGTADLFALLARRMAQAAPPVRVVPAGLPDWVLADSLALADLLEHLAALLARECGVDYLTAAVAREHGRVCLDLVWSGAPVPAGLLEAWLDIPFGDAATTARAVLERHATDCWSQPAGPGEALIRIPLPSAAEPGLVPRRPRAMRPEFYDFDLAGRPAVTDALRERRLRELSYVVFDVETTGLALSKGDEVVSIGAVRVVNGRVLPLETFERIVNPGRPIPPDSVRFHGVTDADVADKPPLAVVLPQFRRFAGDAVLVAHNAAFDMMAIGRGADACGLRFDNPVLDTLLISAWLDPEEDDHSLDGICARMGFEVIGRHTALADSLTAAAILVRQFERLEARGIDRFGKLAVAIDLSARLRQNRMAF
ncbi:DNA polymerase III epsilon subunit [Rhodovastum atsumiense]|uniref:DNA-directed DNA polymerase n=1 Tax=Rhodovastum atsumiense TaxID=504468 RepID=A0A5M6IT32_9PROT|nr:exonuclease domain-containing protein [Rhodovastum atsumiense]KAA5611371.1 PAS domain-containing protein [Rhodovastum atsumiense]CAH2603628.1 DNA polymerase III epsilon subunit [Rhodovastum atsumiense]